MKKAFGPKSGQGRLSVIIYIRFACVIAVPALCYLGGRFAYACLSDQYNSVHFHSGEPDFGIAPRRGVLEWRGEHDDRPRRGNNDYQEAEGRKGLELTDENDDAIKTELDRKYRLCLQSADTFIQREEWSRARSVLQREGETHRWRGDMRDRVQMLKQVEALKTLSSAQKTDLHLYLSGLTADEAGNQSGAQSAFQKVADDPASGFLREHAIYQLASLSAEYFDYPHAVDQYQQLLLAYPHTTKREDALVMIARCALLPQTAAGRRFDTGKAALAQLRREYPHGRFRKSMIGLQGRIYFLAQQWMQALPCYFAVDDLASVEIVCKFLPPPQRGATRVKLMAAYLRRLAHASNLDTYERSIVGLDHTREMLSSTYATALSHLLLEQPDLDDPYLYYRLYHTDLTHKGLLQLAQFADRLIALHPTTQLSTAVQTRLAEVYYQSGRYTGALVWANRALQRGGTDRALFVRGATLNRLDHSDAAFADFHSLTVRFPHSPLLQATRENLALIYEARHDYARALDQYLALSYQLDIAYILDIRMTPDQVAAYRQSHPHSSISNLLTYTLGIRYLRADRLPEALRTLRLVPHNLYVGYQKRTREMNTYSDDDTPSPDPISATLALIKLERAVHSARSDNARASALYHLASYYSTHGTLLLYNVALWYGERELSFQFWWNQSAVHADDIAAVHAYMYSHEVYARSLALCLEVANRYPHSPTVPYALYRAGCASRRLARFNSWWSDEDKHHDYWAESSHLMARLAHHYPHHPLAAHAQKYAVVFQQEKTYWHQ